METEVMNWFYVFFRDFFIQAITLIAILWFLFFGRAKGFFRRHKKTKLGPLEIETETDNQANCPHDKCRSETKAHIAKLWEKTDKAGEILLNDSAIIKDIKSEIDRLVGVVEEIAVDQLKLIFYNREMEETERLIAGLRYVSKDRNHVMKTDVCSFCIQHPVAYRAAVTAAPKLTFAKVEEILKTGQGGKL